MNTSSPFQDETLAQPVAQTSGYPDESAALPALCDREAFQRRLDVVLRMAEKQRSSFAVLLLEAGLPCDASGQADARQLAAVASAIRMAVRLTDTVARLKNSEFGIILSVGNEEGAQREPGTQLGADSKQEPCKHPLPLVAAGNGDWPI